MGYLKRTGNLEVPAMEVLAILTFLTVALLFFRSKYLASSWAEFAPESKREIMIKACDFLQGQGYRIVDERVGHELNSYLGSKKYTTFLIADYIIENEGTRYPVKVRSTRDPERINGVWLRKNFFPLYEQYHSPIAYVDAELGSIEWIDFAMDYPAQYFRKRWLSRLIWLFIGIVLGWLIALATR